VYAIPVLSCVAAVVPAAVAHVRVDVADEKAPISALLYGKFTEHLGRNVYQGMWAQMVVNPEFAPADRWPRRDRLGRLLADAAEAFGLSDLVAAADGGFAPFWAPYGDVSGEVILESGRDVQRIVLGPGNAGLTTGLFLPPGERGPIEVTVKGRTDRRRTVVVLLQSAGGRALSEASLPLDEGWATASASVRLPPRLDVAPGEPFRLSLDFRGPGEALLDRVVAFPSSHEDGWDGDVVRYMDAASVPMLRFPGGNFASGYHWENGVGPLDARPVLPNPAWDVVEWNHVGTDEWLNLCEMVDAVPLICVNAGDGTPEEARRWVEYCNGSEDTPLGKKRADNGHPEPYGVRYWEIGNELYGRWQIGHTDAEGYAERYAQFVAEMAKADPDLVFIANGDTAEWNRTLVRRNGDKVRSISVHTLPGSHIPADADPLEVYHEFMAHADGYGEYLRALAEPMAESGLTPRLAVTELQMFTNKPELPNNQTLTEALWYAGILNVCIRSGGLVELVTHSAMLNHGGGLRKERGVVYANPVWWATHLYTDAGLFRDVPLGVTVEGPVFSTAGKWLAKRENVPYLDAVALASPRAPSVAVLLLNRHPSEQMETTIEFAQPMSLDTVVGDTLTGPDFRARNTWQDPGRCAIQRIATDVADDRVRVVLPPCSLTCLIVTSEAPDAAPEVEDNGRNEESDATNGVRRVTPSGVRHAGDRADAAGRDADATGRFAGSSPAARRSRRVPSPPARAAGIRRASRRGGR
jgi:alpha-N-arabinofuranosidase